jgi:cold shock protein
MAAYGTVKFFNQEKGFGFIATEENGDVFVHANDVQGNPLQEGDQVQFESTFDEMKQKTKASNVTGGTGEAYGGGKGFGGKGKGKGKGKSYGGGYDQGYSQGGYGGGYNQGY